MRPAILAGIGLGKIFHFPSRAAIARGYLPVNPEKHALPRRSSGWKRACTVPIDSWHAAFRTPQRERIHLKVEGELCLSGNSQQHSVSAPISAHEFAISAARQRPCLWHLFSAQSDFAMLQAAFTAAGSTASTSSTSSTTSSNPLAQAFQQLSSDLQSGNITGAQKDYSTIQQDMQNEFSDHSHLGHHHKIGQDPNLSGNQPA